MATIDDLNIKVSVDTATARKETKALQDDMIKAGNNIEKAFWKNTLWALETKLEEFKKSLKWLDIWSTEFKKLQKEINKTEKELQKATWGTSTFSNALRGIWGMIAGAFWIAKITEFSNTFWSMQNALRQVASWAELDILQKKILAIANDARVPVDSLTKSFVRFDLINRQLWWSQDETLKIMDSLSKWLSLSWATAEETASAVLQLSQAFGSWVLQWDEFRALSESMPMLLDILAKSMWVPRWELKNLASEWKITSKVLKEALLEANTQINKSFSETQVTIWQKLTQIRNDFIVKFWEIDKNVWFTDKIVAWIGFIRDAFLSFFGTFPNFSMAIWGILLWLVWISSAVLLLWPAIGVIVPAIIWLGTAFTVASASGGVLAWVLAVIGWPIWLIVIWISALVWVVWYVTDWFWYFGNSVKNTGGEVKILNEKIDELKKSQEELNKQYADGKISQDEYSKKSQELKEKQDQLNLAVKQWTWEAFNYEDALTKLANTSYAPDTEWYIKERIEIEKNIKASIDLLNARKQLWIVAMNKIQSEQDSVKNSDKRAPFTWAGSTSRQEWLSSQLLVVLDDGVKIDSKISKAQKELAGIDEAIKKIREWVDYTWSYWKNPLKDKNNGGSWKTKDQAKEELEAKQKALEAQATLEIEAVKKSELTELQKSQKILAINKKLSEDIKLLKAIWYESDVELAQRTYDETNQNMKDELEQIKRNDKKKEESLKKTKDSLQKVKDAYWEVTKSFEDNIKKSSDAVDDFNTKIWELETKITDLKKTLQDSKDDTGTSLAERKIALEEKLNEIQNKSPIIDKNFTDQYSTEFLKKNLNTWLGNNLDGSMLQGKDVLEAKNIYAELETIKQNANLISEQNSKTAEENDSQRIIRKALEKQLEIQKDIDETIAKQTKLKEDKEAELATITYYEWLKETVDKNYETVRAKIAENITAKEFAELDQQTKDAKSAADLKITYRNNVAAAMRAAWVSTAIDTVTTATDNDTNQKWYASWWYTGSGSKNDIAGVVHAGEWVAPAEMIKQAPLLFQSLEKMRVGGNTSTITKNQTNNFTVNSGMDIKSFIGEANWRL